MKRNSIIKENKGFRIYRNEQLQDSLVRAINEQTEQSVLFCDNFTNEPNTAIHEIRKSNKRIRALLRLFKCEMNEDQFKRSSAFYSNLNHLFAENRIHFMHIYWLKQLATDKRLKSSKEFIDDVINNCELIHSKHTSDLSNDRHTLFHFRKLLITQHELLKVFSTNHLGSDSIYNGLRLTHLKALQRLKKVTENTDTINLHKFRKVIKYLWNQMIFLKPIWPAGLGSCINQYGILGDQLGKDHDLAELEQMLILLPPSIETFNKTEPVIKNIHLRRKQLQYMAMNLADRLFAETSDSFAHRISVYHELFRRKKP